MELPAELRPALKPKVRKSSDQPRLAYPVSLSWRLDNVQLTRFSDLASLVAAGTGLGVDDTSLPSEAIVLSGRVVAFGVGVVGTMAGCSVCIIWTTSCKLPRPDADLSIRLVL